MHRGVELVDPQAAAVAEGVVDRAGEGEQALRAGGLFFEVKCDFATVAVPMESADRKKLADVDRKRGAEVVVEASNGSLLRLVMGDLDAL
jgi:hypothetical protein